MKISMIAAMTHQRLIGDNNSIPWHLPADFAWFKKQTVGKPIVMGRKTFESIGRPLPNRRNVVISRNTAWQADGVEVVHDAQSALQLLADSEEVMIIGGSKIYEAYLQQADRLYLTFIDAELSGDAYFPEWGNDWQEVHSEQYSADENNQYEMTFTIFERQ